MRVLGLGGMGVVYEAEHERLKRRVAVKMMRKPQEAEQSDAGKQFREAKGRFLREARAAAALHDDHVVTIYDFGEQGDEPFLVMEFLKGETLHDRLRRAPRMPLAEAVRIVREVALGLAAAHAAGLVHRDIKPANLWLVEPDDPGQSFKRVKILDFGLARLVEGDEQYTRTGQAPGTPAFMAPEQAGAGPLDARADLFSLGCVLYLLATGRQPFRGLEVMLYVGDMHSPQPPCELDPAVPAALSDLVMRLLAKRPDDRPPSAAAVAAGLRAIEVELAGGPLPETLTHDLGGGVSMEFVRIPTGTFTMGSTDGNRDEKPPHRVTITKLLYMGKTAVTVGQFKRFVTETGHKTEDEAAGAQRTWRNPGFIQTDNHPVVLVSWNDADKFCTWLREKTRQNVVLPTEAEWEYSCLAGSTTKFYFGDDEEKLGEFAWYQSNTRFLGTHPSGQKKPNAWGLYDMHGNVREWCRDGKRTYDNQAETDPEEPGAGDSCVLRGGSFCDVPRRCRAASRRDRAPADRIDYLGFRVSVSR